MFKNYFKTAWRNLIKSRVYSFINITGLAIGLAVCMLIMLYVSHENSFDKFHANANNIYYVKAKIRIGEDSLYMTQLSAAVAPSLKEKQPAVEAFLRMRQERQAIIQSSQNSSLKFAEDRFYFTDSNFFNFFSFKLLSGSKEKVLQNPFSVVISQKAAQKYFGNENPVGKTIRLNNEHDFLITGIAAEAPSNSTIQFDFMASLSSIASMKTAAPDNMEEDRFTTYFLVKHPADINKIEAGLLALERPKNKLIGRFIGIPLTDISREEDTNATSAKYIKIFSVVAALILLLALINYMSLSTARSTTRTKEIGVRKALGAGRGMIAQQFFAESALYTSIAFVLAFILCTLAQPFFFNFLQINFDSPFLWTKNILLLFALLYVITTLLAATYPSVLLSAFKPVTVLYGKITRQSNGISVRKFFTVFQFSASVILIICGIVINKQIQFLKNTDTGVNRENILMIPFTPAAAKHYNALKKDLVSLPGISDVGTALHPFYKGFDMMATKLLNSKEVVLLPTMSVDQHFMQMLGLKWKTPPSDSLFYHNPSAVVINETAIQKLGLDANPINKKMDDELTVTGIVKDFNYASLQNKIDALALFVTQDSDTASLWAKNGGCFYLKTNSNTNVSGIINRAKTIYEQYDAEAPFTYNFLDDAFNAMYKAEEKLLKLLTTFTAFTIFIACLGLFGLAAFTVVQRTKEVGIRKVLGATTGQLSLLLSKDFIKLVFIAIVIASPLAWWLMNKWLDDFAYRINIAWWMFAAAGVLAIVIALMTVSFQALKAALTNPVKSLRTE